MRKILVILCFSFTASAGPVVGPIYMSGSGTYSWDYGGGPGVTFTASGSSGGDSVSMSVMEGNDLFQFVFPGLPGGLSSFPSLACIWSGLVRVDGISGSQSPGCIFGGVDNGATWSLGGGGGSVDIFDPGENLLASASLIGYLQYTDVTETFNGNTVTEVNADFNIVSTLEPSAWSLCLAGLAMAALGSLRCSSTQVARRKHGATPLTKRALLD